MAVNGFTNIVTNGLVLSLDAGNLKSYPTSGTTWTDLTRNGYNSTLTLGPSFSSSNGGNIVFDGTNDYVITTLTNSTGISNPTLYSGKISVNCWFKTTSTRASQYVLSSGAQTSSTGIALIVNDSGTNDYFAIRTQTKSWGVYIDTLDIDIWHNICFLTDDSNFYVYKNGVLISTTTSSPATLTPNNLGFVMGAPNNNVSILLLQGNISNVQIYNRALSASEVLQNYNATKWRFI